MSLLGMPWVVVNLGCEMVYILEQRLKAQGIVPDKSKTVLQDIVRTMFDQKFMAEKLFVPQEMYSLHSTRKIFDRLAHSSIMRLSESSMDKLFDLMVMGAKYQLLCSAKLDDLIQITLRHLHTVQTIMGTTIAASSATGDVDVSVMALISKAEAATVSFYGTLSRGELALLRHTLARFFQDKRVKVSLFLNEGIQSQSGKLVVPSCITDQVGVVRTFGADGKLDSEEKLQVASQKAGVTEFFCHPVPLGDNLYNKDRPKVIPPARDSDKVKDKSQFGSPATDLNSQSGRYADDEAYAGSAAAKELDLLAAIVQVNKSEPADNFKLNLFENAAADSRLTRTDPPTAIEKQQRSEIHFGTESRSQGYLTAVQDVLQGVDFSDPPGAKASVGEELLDLMDGMLG